MKFIGREKELQTLENLKKKKSASLAVLSGRRRIGKSRLAEEFGKDSLYYTFSGIPPSPETTAASQRKAFALQVCEQLEEMPPHETWYELLTFLATKTQKKEIVILLDEISWMGSKDPDFLGVLKTVWDNSFKKNPKLILILCGSVSAWINKNILSNTGFMGRISLHIHLKELTLEESAQFWKQNSSIVSAHEILKTLSIVGGVPRYLEEINPKASAEDNIKRLCFNRAGPLYSEFDQIFSDLFNTRANIYKRIIKELISGALERNQLSQTTGLAPNSVFTEYMDDLMQAGFIQRDFTWHLNSHNTSKISKYRLSDNYIRFYLKYVASYKTNIEKGHLDNLHLSTLKNWGTIMGLQLENLVLNNRKYILEAMNIPPEIVLNDGPYFQRKTLRNPGCQIDYLIQTKLGELYVGEIKFSKHEIKFSVIEEVKERVKSLKTPKGLTIRTFLIHVNGVSESILDEDYFTHIINLGDLLKLGQ